MLTTLRETLSRLAASAVDFRPHGVIASGVGVGLRFEASDKDSPYLSGGNELPVQKALAHHLRLGQVFYDVGANEGFFTVLGARLTGPEGAVVAFEPEPKNATRVRINAAHNQMSWTTIVEAAVSHQSGRADLLLTRHGGGHTLRGSGMPPDVRDQITVNTTSIDDFVASGASRPPDVVKIDVEGAEVQVLNGMRATLTSARPVVIYEIDDADRDRFDEKLQQVRTLFRALGYTFRELPRSYHGDYPGAWHVAHDVALPAAATPPGTESE